ncbi:hypothetical protein SDC9_195665 [bioreactor metagenome]|uniref:Uncharacterized protein n=1 Tax=bioreactor metagenome TaxID=1076179 RepID=A0A645I9P9_9ZZZZ
MRQRFVPIDCLHQRNDNLIRRTIHVSILDDTGQIRLVLNDVAITERAGLDIFAQCVFISIDYYLRTDVSGEFCCCDIRAVKHKSDGADIQTGIGHH